jgi:hypothetical protein
MEKNTTIGDSEPTMFLMGQTSTKTGMEALIHEEKNQLNMSNINREASIAVMQQTINKKEGMIKCMQ